MQRNLLAATLVALMSLSTALRADSRCDLPEDEIEIRTTALGVDFVRTPDACFRNLPGYRFRANYVRIDGLRMHYIDAGPSDGPVVLMLHGQPAWSYLYRRMVPVLVSYGYRVIVPDHIGMGKSDKPIDPTIHEFEQHVDWTKQFIAALGLDDINLVIHDWGSHFGFRVAGNDPQRFDRIIAMNADLAIIPAGLNPFVAPTFEIDDALDGLDAETFFMNRSSDPVAAFQEWIDYAASHPDLSAGDVVQVASLFPLYEREVAAYDAPFPSLIYKAAIRAFPSMIAGIEQQNVPAFNTLGTYTNPFLFLAGEFDPNQGSVENQLKWTDHVPGAEGNSHRRYLASHFIQEDAGARLARQIARFIGSTEAGEVPTGGGTLFHARSCEILLVMPSGVAEIWGSSGLNDCPQAQWDALDFEAIGQQYGAIEVRPNGPFYTIMDESVFEQPAPPPGGMPPQVQLRDYGGITMRLLTTTNVSESPAGSRYTPSLVARNNTWVYVPGRRIFELVDPDGARYVMQLYNTGVDRDLAYADLETLGERLSLPDGWAYRSYIAEQGLSVSAVDGIARAINDDFSNVYQLVP